MAYELIGGLFDDDFDVAGEDDYSIGGLDIVGADEDAIAGALYGDEFDAIAGLEDDLSVLAGYDPPSSEVARLLQATAGFAPPRGRAAARTPVRGAPAQQQRRAAAARVARTVNTLGRQLQRERGRTAQAVQQLRQTRGAASPSASPSARVVPAAGGGSRTLVEREPTRTGVAPIGITSEGPVPAGATKQITVRPQLLFRPTKYHVSESVGQNFLINSIVVGKNNQFATSGPLPATTFSDEQLRFAFSTCQPGQDITVTVTNITSADHIFTSSMWGDSAE
jgi:hypothetical protein